MFRLFRRRLVAAANESMPEVRFVSAANEMQEDVKDTLFIPFGERMGLVTNPKTGKVAMARQVFDVAAANAMVEDMNSVPGKVARVLRQIPIYEGHPDHELFADRNVNTRALGWVTGAAVANDGMNVSVKWNKFGQELLAEKAYQFYSPNWGLEIKDFSKSPLSGMLKRLFSIGLTNQPNWPVPSIANEEALALYSKLNAPAGDQEGETKMNVLQRLLALIGVETVKTEDDVVSWVQTAITALKNIKEACDARWKAEDAARLATAANAAPEAKLIALFDDRASQLVAMTATLETTSACVTRLQGEVAVANQKATDENLARVRAETDLADAKTKVTAADGLVAAANAKHLAVVTARAKEHTDVAIANGLIVADKRADLEAEFIADFDKTLVKVANMKPIMKLAAKTTGLSRRTTASDASKQFSQLVQEALPKFDGDYDKAWAACANSHKDLLDQMQQPARDFTGGKK